MPYAFSCYTGVSQLKLRRMRKKMKVLSKFLGCLHLDQGYSLLSARNVAVLLEFFRALDIRGEMVLDDIQFYAFMKSSTDLGRDQIYHVFDMLDVNCLGLLKFDQFYLFICILIATKDKQEKQFIFRHSRTIFQLLDHDGSGRISVEEFETFGFIFGYQSAAIKDIFHEFDVSGDQELDYQEFCMFTTACVDRQKQIVVNKETRNKCCPIS